MKFVDKYTTQTESTLPENKDKSIIGEDAFAIGEAIDLLIAKIERVRVSLR